MLLLGKGRLLDTLTDSLGKRLLLYLVWICLSLYCTVMYGICWSECIFIYLFVLSQRYMQWAAHPPTHTFSQSLRCAFRQLCASWIEPTVAQRLRRAARWRPQAALSGGAEPVCGKNQEGWMKQQSCDMNVNHRLSPFNTFQPIASSGCVFCVGVTWSIGRFKGVERLSKLNGTKTWRDWRFMNGYSFIEGDLC